MEINLVTSKTVIASVLLAVGEVCRAVANADSFPAYTPVISAASVFFFAVGTVLGGVGVRHAIAKSAKGVSQ